MEFENFYPTEESETEKDNLSESLEKEENFSQVYQGSELFKMKEIQNQQGREFTTLFTDFDKTFFREDRAVAREELTTRMSEENIPLIVVTGKDFSTILSHIKDNEAPHFQTIIGSVGTERFGYCIKMRTEKKSIKKMKCMNTF